MAVAASEVVTWEADLLAAGDVAEVEVDCAVASDTDADGVAEAAPPDEIVAELSPRILNAAGNADDAVAAALGAELREAAPEAAADGTTAVVVETVPPAGGADELPLTGVRTQTVTCWTSSCPFTTMGERVTVHD